MNQFTKRKVFNDEPDGNGAIGIQPKVYEALLTQTGTNAPVITVLYNTLGFTPVIGYSIAGKYQIQANAGYTANKTVMYIGSGTVQPSHIEVFTDVGGDIFIVSAVDGSGLADDLLYKTPILIKVYP